MPMVSMYETSGKKLCSVFGSQAWMDHQRTSPQLINYFLGLGESIRNLSQTPSQNLFRPRLGWLRGQPRGRSPRSFSLPREISSDACAESVKCSPCRECLKLWNETECVMNNVYNIYMHMFYIFSSLHSQRGQYESMQKFMHSNLFTFDNMSKDFQRSNMIQYCRRNSSSNIPSKKEQCYIECTCDMLETAHNVRNYLHQSFWDNNTLKNGDNLRHSHSQQIRHNSLDMSEPRSNHCGFPQCVAQKPAATCLLDATQLLLKVIWRSCFLADVQGIQ